MPGKERQTIFHKEFREDLKYWVETDRRTAIKIFKLIEAVVRNLLEGIGKPEPLKYGLQGAYSRRITQEHRLVYVTEKNLIHFIQCRYHYE